MFCFCFFGLMSHYFFSENEEYYKTPSHSTLTYLQVATLDQIGKIINKNLERYGFVKSFLTMLASLAILHILFNVNQALIMQYVYRKRHNEVVVSSRREFTGEVKTELKLVRIINIVTTSLVFMFPFQ